MVAKQAHGSVKDVLPCERRAMRVLSPRVRFIVLSVCIGLLPEVTVLRVFGLTPLDYCRYPAETVIAVHFLLFQEIGPTWMSSHLSRVYKTNELFRVLLL